MKMIKKIDEKWLKMTEKLPSIQLGELVESNQVELA